MKRGIYLLAGLLLPALARGEPITPPPPVNAPSPSLYTLARQWQKPQTFEDGIISSSGQFSGILTDTQMVDTFNGGARVDYRNILNQTIVSPSQPTNNILENDNSFVYITKPGQMGEVNLFHGYLEVEPGATLVNYENFEASNYNMGSIASGASFLALAHNASNGTLGGFIGLRLGLVNDNATAGSFNQYVGVDLEAMAGNGIVPDTFYFLRNAEARASISTRGGVNIGALNPVPAGYLQLSGQMLIYGPDSTSSSYPILIRDSAGTIIFSINGAGQLIISNGNGSSVTGATCTGQPSVNHQTYQGVTVVC